MSTPLNLLRAERSRPATPTTSFAGKTILITGSNTGLGLKAARHFLSLSSSPIILAVRSLPKGYHAAQLLEAEFPDAKKGIISVLSLEMNSYVSIQGFVEHVNAEYERLDVAILNAGLVNWAYRKSSEGREETLLVSTISTALLALLLLPKLRAEKKDPLDRAHLVIISSESHAQVKRSSLPLSSQDILHACSDGAHEFDGQNQYNLFKAVCLLCG